jgi:tricorn protease
MMSGTPTSAETRLSMNWEVTSGSLTWPQVTSARVPVKILTDMEERRPFMKDVSRNITRADISPSGSRALVVARGDIFTLPEKEGPVRNLTASSGARDKDAVWSPDGKWIAYFSDASGEYELYIMNLTAARSR